MYTCPVCFYDQMEDEPDNFNICPGCYTEFGYDDATRTHAELRHEWQRNGARWAAETWMPAPAVWPPREPDPNP